MNRGAVYSSAIATAVVVVSAAGCKAWFQGESPAAVDAQVPAAPRRAAKPSATVPAAVTPMPKTTDPRRYAYRLPGMDCLVSAEGIRRKCLITVPGARCTAKPDGGRSTGPRLRFFMPYFVFGVHPAKGPIQSYRIGSTPQRESIIGWLRASQAAPWDTRVGARYRRVPGGRTPPLLIYLKPEALIELVTTGRTRHKPMARAAYDASRTWMPWPIAESRHITHQGRSFELVRLNFLGEFQGDSVEPANGRKRYSDGELKEIKSGVKMLDIAFCLDTTLSTADEIEGMRDAVRMIARRLHRLPFKPDVSCALVEYRDYVPGIMFKELGLPSVVKVYPQERDLNVFLKRVGGVREAAHSSIDWAEAGYDGIHAALTRTPWRGRGLSARVVVLIGDNSFHPPGSKNNPKNIGGRELVRLATGKTINAKIYSLCVKGDGGPPERRAMRAQFTELAEGTGGKCYDLHGAAKIVDHVRAILETQSAVVHRRSVVLDALAEGKSSQQIAVEKNMDVRQVTEVMRFLRGGGVDLDRLRPGVPAFASGWCLAEVDGVPLLEKEVYVARAELDVLLAELNSLCVHLSPDIARRAFRTGVGSRINPMSFFADRRPETMDVFLLARGVPAGGGLLKLTRSDVEHMSEERRAVLRERIARQVVPQLTNARNDDRYFTWLNDLEFGWIKESLLP